MIYKSPLQKAALPNLHFLRIVFLITYLVSSLIGPTPGVQAAHIPPGDYVSLPVPLAPGGNIVDLVVAPSDPNVLYALVTGDNGYDLYRSLDGGLSWDKRHIFSYWIEHITLLTVDPENSNLIYAYGNSQDYYQRSMDGGATWEYGDHPGGLLAAPASNRLYVVSGEARCNNYDGNIYTLYRTDNGGETWSNSDLGCLYGISGIAVLHSQPDTIYLTVLKLGTPENYLIKSTDSGQTWQEFALSFDPFRGLMIDPDNPDRLYASGSWGIFASPDGGETWQKVSLPTMGAEHKMAVSGGILYAVQSIDGRAPLYRSDDGGKTWWASADFLPAGVNMLQASQAQPGKVWAGLIDYGVYFSDNGGASWSEQNAGIQSTTRVNLLAASAGAPNVVYAAAAAPYAGLYRSTDSGKTWSTRMPGLEDAGLSPMQASHSFSTAVPNAVNSINYPALKINKLLVHPLHAEIAWAATSAGVYETTDGLHWVLASLPMNVIDLAVSPADPDYVLGIMRDSQNFPYLIIRWCYPSPLQCEWSYNHIFNDLLTYNTISLDPLIPHRIMMDGIVYISGGTVPGVYDSLDFGSTWNLLGQMNVAGKVSGLVIAPQNPRFILAFVENFPDNTHWLLRSQDGGANWNDWSTGEPELFGRKWSLAIDDLGAVYAGTGLGVYRRMPDQAAWEPYWLDQLLMRGIAGLAYIPGPAPKLLATTDRVLWALDLPPIQHIWMPLVIGSMP